MKRMIVLLAIVLFMGAFAVDGGNAQAQTLRVATEAGFMPFEFVDADTNELVGFDMDLIRAIGAAMDMEVTITNINWDGLIPGLMNNNFDVIIAGMTITEERAQSVNFSDPYFESVLTVVTRDNDDSIASLEDLAGKTVAVQISTTGDFVADDVEGIGRVSRFDTVAQAMQAVAIRSTQAAIIDLPVAEAYLSFNSNAPLQHLGAVADNEYYGIAVRKQNPELVEKINVALAELQADGTYDEIYNNWFGSVE